MTITIHDGCTLDAVSVVYRGRFQIRLRPDGYGRWDAISIIDGVWFQRAKSPEAGIAWAISHIDETYPATS